MPLRWNRAGRIAAIVAGCIVVLIVAAALLLNSAIGLRSTASLVGPLSDGHVLVEGLSGRLPYHPHARRVEIRDRDGAWLVAENVDLDWAAFTIFHNRLDANALTAEHAQLLRLPVKDNTESNFSLDIRSLRIARLDVAQKDSRMPASLRVEGSVRYMSLKDWAANLAANRLDAAGNYELHAAFDDGFLTGTADITEPSGGIATSLLNVKPMGDIALHLRGEGARDANRTHIALTAGPLRVTGDGKVNFLARTAELDFTAEAPEMNLRDDLTWKSLAAEGHLRGAFDNPDVNAGLDIRDLDFQDVRAAGLSGRVEGMHGDLNFNAIAKGLRLPGPRSDLFARDPVAIKGSLDLEKPARAFTVSLSHPMLSVEAQGTAGDAKHVRAVISVPRIAPFAQGNHVAVDGRTKLTAEIDQSGDNLRIAVNGTIDAMGKSTPLARLIGANAKLSLTATGKRSDVTISDARLQGAGGNVRFSGRARNSDIDLDWSVAIDDLALLSSRLVGNLRASGQARGPWEKARVDASATADIGTPKIRKQQVTFTLNGVGLPPQSGNFRAQGRFDDAPLSLQGQLAQAQGGVKATIDQASWKTLQARGDVAIPSSGPVSGKANLHLSRLGDIASIIEAPIAGAGQADVAFTINDAGFSADITAQTQDIAYQNVTARRAHTDAKLDLQSGRSALTLKTRANALAYQGATIQDATIEGKIDGIFEQPSVALDIDAQSLAAARLSGNAKAQVQGPKGALNVRFSWDPHDAAGNAGRLSATAKVDLARNQMQVAALNAEYRGETAALEQPFTLAFGRDIAIDRLVLKLRNGQLSLSGTLSPRIAAHAIVENASPALLAPYVTELSNAGSLSATADLSGSLDHPEGTFTVQGRGLRARRASAVIMPASLEAHGTLRDDALNLNAEISAGPSFRATISGDVALRAKPELNLKLDGQGDLAFLNPLLSAEGRKLQGRAVVNVSLGGTFDAPRIDGRGTLSGGEVQDIPSGFRIHDISLAAEGTGEQIRIRQFNGQAGDGTISGNGTIDLSQPKLPVSFTVTANNARPLVSDRFTATMDANLRVTGTMRDEILVAGNVDVTRGEITLPERTPAAVVVLDVRRPQKGEAAPESDPSFASVRYDLTIAARGRVSVKGRGLDAEVGGTARMRGTTDDPQITGGFDLRRGTFTVAAQTFMLTTGRVTFDGVGIRNKLDPSLDLAAENTTGGITAKLAITGYASAPRIELSSTPMMPADEILARMLFGQSAAQLSPGQLATLAQAVLSLTSGGSRFDPLGSIRRQLGLSRLDLSGGGSATSNPTVEAGKYILGNVYVGAKQGLEGSTQAEVQVDITNQLKVVGTVNTGANTAVTQGAKQRESGSSIGLSYQFEY